MRAGALRFSLPLASMMALFEAVLAHFGESLSCLRTAVRAAAYRCPGWLHYGTLLRKQVRHKRVRHKRVPVVQATPEVLKEDGRRSGLRAETPVCVTDSAGPDEAGWRGDVGILCHLDVLG
jgi:hypothetical protein